MTVPGVAHTGGGSQHQEWRRGQLRLITDPGGRDEWLVGELTEVERSIHDRIDLHETTARTDFTAFREEVRESFTTIRAELKERDAKTDKRLTAIQGLLIAALSSTAVASIALSLNLAAGT